MGHRARLRAALLASSALVAVPAAAQEMWLATPGSPDFNTAANWDPATVPSDLAIFGNSSTTSLTFSASRNVGTFQFNSGAPAYTFTLSGGFGVLFYDGGIVNSSSNAPSFVLNSGGTVTFDNASTAGNATITTNISSTVSFLASSTGGDARFITNVGGIFDISGLGAAGMTAGSIEGAGTYLLGAKALTVGSNNLSTEVTGVISGVGGSLTKVGTGTLTLSNANTYDGGTTISGGTVVANSMDGGGVVDALGSGTVMLDGGTLQFGVSGSFLNFTQTTANKTSTISPGTQTVSIDGGLLLGAGSTIQFGKVGDTGTVVMGGGSIADTSNAVVVAGGKLQDDGSGSLANLTTFASTTVNAGATLDLNDAGIQAMRNLSGAGSVITGTVGGTNLALLTDQNTTSTWGGVISGPGGVTVQSWDQVNNQPGVGATMIFTGANTYTGGTLICACSTLQLGTLSAAGSIVGEVTNEGVFNVVNSTTSGITKITNVVDAEAHFFNGTSASAAQIVNNGGSTTFHDMSSAGTADIGNRNGGETSFLGQSTAANATIDNNDGTTTFSGQSTAANANIDNRNFGTTNFIGQSTAGNADIDNRTGGWTVFGTMGGTDTATAGNATITNRPTGGETIFQALTTAGNATIVNNGGTTSFFEGSNAGSANINNRNGGLTVFADNSSAMNATIINHNGDFFFGPSQTVFSGNSTAGNANITNQSLGATMFTENTNAGTATIVNNAGGATIFGTPQLNDAPSAANATITNNNDGTTFFLAFSTAGNATIITNGGGATLFGDGFGGLANSTGGNAQFITNAGGIVDFSQTAGLNGDKKVAAGSIAGAGDYYLGGIELTVGSNNLSTTVSGTINDGLSPLTCGCGVPGTGASLVKVGTGTLTLAGINTYTGPTTINAGTLEIAAAGSITSNVTNNAMFLNAGLVTGNLINNAGTTFNTGLITGSATVNGGLLSVNGTVAGPVTVNVGGTLGGTGTVGATTINGGNLSPGNSIGTITVNSNLTFVGAGNYIVEVSPSAADKTNVVGAPGTANVAGTLSAVGTGGVYTVGTKYTVISTTGGVSGTFGNLAISGNFGVTKPHIEYDANNVYLVLDPNALPLAGLTPNQTAVAGAVNSAVGGGSQAAPFAALFNLAVSQLPGALDQLSGEVHASNAGVLLDESLYPRLAVLGRLRQASYGGNTSMASLALGGPQAFAADGANAMESALAYAKSPIVTKAPMRAPAASNDVVFWAQGFAARGNFGADGNAANVTRDLAGIFSGVDTPVASTGRVGVMTGYTGSYNALARRGGASVETGHLAGYAGWSFGALSLRAGAAAAWHTIHTSRMISFPGVFDSLNAHYNGRTAQIFGEAGYGFALANLAVEPFAGAAWVRLNIDGANERGGAAALALAANTFEVGYSTLGIRAASMIPVGNDMVLIPRVSAAWQHAFNDVTPDARLAFLAAPVPFVVAGAPIARDSLLGEAGLDLAIGRNATVGISYTGQIARNVHDHAAKGKFSWKF